MPESASFDGPKKIPERPETGAHEKNEATSKIAEGLQQLDADILSGQLREGLNLTALSAPEFKELLKDVRTPLETSGPPAGLFNDKQMACLDIQRSELEKAQKLAMQDIDNSLENIRNGYPLTADEASGARAVLVDFLKQRWRYEAELKRKEPERKPWMTYAGVAFQEILEEAGEKSLNFGEQSVFKKYVPGLEKLDTALMTKFEAGAEQAGKILAQRGITPPKTIDVVRSIGKLSFGKEFWEKLLTIESPVTVVLFAFYLHGATDKVKAAMQFASFLATSAATSELLGIAQNVIARSQYTLRTTPLMRSRLTAGSMRMLRFAPKNPMVQFAVMLGVMFGINEILDTYVISPTVEAIPDGDWKHGAGGAVSTLSGETLLGHADWALQETGLQDVDPENEEAYLSQEYLTDNSINPLSGLDTRFVHTIREWNDKLENQIKAEKKRNPLRAKMWESHRIDDPNAWAQQKAATELFPLAQYAKQKEQEFIAELRSRKDDPLRGGGSLRLLSLAAADTDEWDKDLGETTYGVGRNDRALDYIVDKSGTTENNILRFVNALPAKDPVKEQWKEYVGLCKQIGRKVALYRHLDIGYSRERWLGNMTQIPAFAKDGFIEAIVHDMKRGRAYEFTGQTKEEAIRHGGRVADAIKVEKNDIKIATMPTETAGRLVEGVLTTGGNIASDIKNLPGIVTGRKDSKFQGEIADASRGEYAFGDKRLNRKNSLSNVLESAGSVLPADKQNDVQAAARKLAASTEIASPDEMRSAQMEAVNAIGEYGDTQIDVSASPDIRSDIGIDSDVPVYFGSRTESLGSPLAGNFLKEVFGGAYAGKSDTDRSPLAPRLYGSDVVVFHYIQPSQGSIVMTMNVIHCGSADRKIWTVDVRRATYELTLRGHNIERTDTKDVPFAEWASRQRALKNGQSPLSQEFLRQEKNAVERRREADLASDASLSQYKKELERSKKSDVFVRLSEGEFRRGFDGFSVVYHPPHGARVSAVPKYHTGTSRQSANEPFTFELRKDPDMQTEPWQMRNISFLNDASVTPAHRKIFLEMLTTPNENDDAEAIDRILGISDHDVYRPNAAMALLNYSPGYYKAGLRQQLLPIYKDSTNKRAFLTLLATEIAAEGAITEKLAQKLPEKLKNLE